MNSRISLVHDNKTLNSQIIHTKEIPGKKIEKTVNRRKRKNKTNITKIKLKKEINPIFELKDSLRLECIRLADFLKQESHRDGFVR
jgi:hypothetical protein